MLRRACRPRRETHLNSLNRPWRSSTGTGSEGLVKPVSEFPLADLYVCWDRKAIYLGLCAQDVVEDVFYRGKTVLASDRAEWIVSISGSSKPIRGRIGAGMEPVFDEPSVRAMNISGINGNVRNIAGLELPAKLFGKGSDSKRATRSNSAQPSSPIAALTAWSGTPSSSCEPGRSYHRSLGAVLQHTGD